MTFEQPLDRIDAAALQRLVENRVPEDRRLEYKEALPGDSDRDKREFLADITAFANTAGGDLIYGIRQHGGLPQELVGLPGRDLDQERVRLEQLARDGVRPRLSGLRFKPIDRGSAPPCLLVRVPRSPVGLHMVTLGGLKRFYGRGSGGRYELDVDEIRTGFVARDTAVQRARWFRADRLAAITAGEGPVRVAPPLVVFHMIPLTTWDAWGRFIQASDQQRHAWLPTLLEPTLKDSGRSAEARFNLDGWWRGMAEVAWVQLFRHGAIESVASLRPFGPPQLSGGTLERYVLDAFDGYRRFLDEAQIDPPLALGPALVGVQRFTLVAGSGLLREFPGFTPTGFDRDPVIVPETPADDLAQPADVILRPLFDALWNAAGWPRSPHYRSGRWQPPGRS